MKFFAIFSPFFLRSALRKVSVGKFNSLTLSSALNALKHFEFSKTHIFPGMKTKGWMNIQDMKKLCSIYWYLSNWNKLLLAAEIKVKWIQGCGRKIFAR